MVGNQEAVRAHKTARTAGIEADGGFLEMFEPGIGGVELVTVMEDLPGRLVEEPHPLIGARGKGKSQ